MFTLTIHTRSGSFGDTAASERHAVARLLTLAAHEIQSGAAPTPLTDQGHVIGEYEFAPEMINGPGPGYDRSNVHVKPANEGGKVRRPVAPAAAVEP